MKVLCGNGHLQKYLLYPAAIALLQILMGAVHMCSMLFTLPVIVAVSFAYCRLIIRRHSIAAMAVSVVIQICIMYPASFLIALFVLSESVYKILFDAVLFLIVLIFLNITAEIISDKVQFK